MGTRTFVWAVVSIALAASSHAQAAPASNGESGGCSCDEKRLRSGYLVRSLIETRNALAILKRIDAGDVEGAQALAREIIKGGKVEIGQLLNQDATDAEARSARKAIDDIESYLDATK